MNSHFVTQRPTIYADMNVFRYVACGDISIVDPERVIWVYSYAHLDEIFRNGNTDALEGMRALKAIEVCDVLNKHFRSEGNIRLRDYVDPFERYERHLEANELTRHDELSSTTPTSLHATNDSCLSQQTP